jgi:hypothetical protein
MLQMAERWTPDTWRNKPTQQVPDDYPDRAVWPTSKSSSPPSRPWYLQAKRGP